MAVSELQDDTKIDLSRSRILVVDDQPINIETISNALSPHYTVLFAQSGEESLELCLKNQPDLILLDVVMPGMSGLELCQQLKNRAETVNIPIIFVTSLNQQHEEDECWRCGGVDFITKPIHAMTVKNRVRAHLTLKLQ